MIYEEFRAVTAVITRLDQMIKSIESLEQRDWVK